MSGDVQPRKRKDKKRKKDDEDAVKETPGGKQPSAGAAQAATQPGDVQMHVHSDHGTGGHWCAKVVFFILLAGLGALIGLILLENRGISDVDTPLSESRYAEYFSGWVDENHEDDHHHEDILNAINQLDDHGDDGDDNGHGDDDGHGDEDEEHGDDDENGAPYAEEDDHDDENGGGEDDDDDEDEEPMKLDDDEVEEIVATEKKVARQEAAAASDDDDDDDEGDNDDEDDNNNDDTVDNDDDENDNDNEDDDDDDQVNDGDQEDDDDDEDEDQNEVDDQVVDDNDDDDDDDADDEDDGDDDDDDNEAEPAIATQDDDDDNDDNDAQSDDNDEDDDDQGTVTEDKEDGDDDNDGDEDDDDENEPAADQQQQQQDDDDDNDDGDDKNDADIKTADDDEDDDDNEQPDTAPDDGDDVDDDVKLADADDNDADDKLADVDGDDNDQDDDDDNAPFEEENKSNASSEKANQFSQSSVLREGTSEENVIPEKQFDAVNARNEPNKDTVISADILKNQMDELMENYNKLAEMLDVPKEERIQESDANNAKDDNDDDDDDGQQNNAADEEDETEKKADDDDEDDEDDDNDDNVFENFVDNDDGEEEYLAKVKQEQEQQIQQKKQQEQEDSREETSQIPSRPSASETYEEELERARKQLDELKNPKLALEHYESLLDKHPRLVPAMVGKARALDLLAEQRQSNAILEDAIESYLAVVSLGDDVDDETLVSVAERCIERVRFRGQHMKAVEVHQALIHRFEAEPRYRNQLAVTYLLSNRLAEAKAVLHETLMRWIEDGFALVHYGFVLKNLDKDMEQAAQYLQEGIDTGHPGTQDGRFYFHLGDALQRLGRQQEALDVYQRAAEKKLFPSMYQRSLYNVGCLQSRPFWTIEQTTFAGQLELIRSQWAAIRDEGLKLLNSVGSFRDEAENLRDTGDWKQFELFARGQRIEKNCARAPLTCKLVEQFTAARSCKRGQVKFSVMHPGTHVWPHCGPTNCRIRAHLGLKVPSSTFIRVATETRSWENGKWLIFDDSFEHEVWHNGTSTRLVLIVDFWHPDLTDVQRKSLNPI
ncbi:aspartyl/asparaginyl beta-hydroxylase isoform X4 [Toxorhynchites rutilus septentrionalis]|uniref:aspartyl/asparaginyl beta-hydroxylase isoform X4 n=1 Tax=Toxorhynchites rutilus septentrionalis TaxID=329112 RepID=UPI002478A2B8|nr:aspartyl/asparaginyl beta-hydroxylase isoform X4 [Toxorhynchites rutilus septentrionalis]